METATEIVARNSDKAYERYQRDRRFRMMVEAVAHRAVTDAGQVDPWKTERHVYRVATDAASLMLEVMFGEDGELASLRQQNERLIKDMGQLINLKPFTHLATPPQDDAS